MGLLEQMFGLEDEYRRLPNRAPIPTSPPLPRTGPPTLRTPPLRTPDEADLARMGLGWQPGPTSPFGGIGTYDWKSPDRPAQLVGSGTSYGMSEDYLQLLHLLGRRRLPPELSGVGRRRGDQ